MAVAQASPARPITRRKFLKGGLFTAAGLAIYAGLIERHAIGVTRHEVAIPDLPAAFEGARIVQLSDIHLDEFTEPLFLEHAVAVVDDLDADFVFLTGDYVTYGMAPRSFGVKAAWQCADILRKLKCQQRYAVLGNHDVSVGSKQVRAAFEDHGTRVLVNACLPLERGNSRIWLCGLDDSGSGRPKLDLAIPAEIRGIREEPVILLCHEPDYADRVVEKGFSDAVSLMLSGHSHGGQVRVPLIGPLILPPGAKKYVEGWFRFGNMQLYVNRGLGTIGLPFRFDCPPEISLFTLKRDGETA